MMSKLCDLLGEDSSNRLKALLNGPEAADDAHFLRIEVNLCTVAGYVIPNPNNQAGSVAVMTAPASSTSILTTHV